MIGIDLNWIIELDFVVCACSIREWHEWMLSMTMNIYLRIEYWGTEKPKQNKKCISNSVQKVIARIFDRRLNKFFGHFEAFVIRSNTLYILLTQLLLPLWKCFLFSFLFVLFYFIFFFWVKWYALSVECVVCGIFWYTSSVQLALFKFLVAYWIYVSFEYNW